ncbi:MAG: amidohydrolase family protein [Acidimicrobiales bacterium]
MHAHFLPTGLVERLRTRSQAPNISVDANGSVSIGIHRTRIPYNAAFDNAQERLAAMDRSGIEHQVLSLPGLFGIDSQPGEEAIELTAAFNNGVGALVAAYPNRFSGMASLPITEPHLAAREYRRTRNDLGLIGMILPGDAFVSGAQARTLRPLFDAAQEVGGLVFIHPGPLCDDRSTVPVNTPALHSDNVVHRRATVDIQNRLTEVMVTLALSNFLDEYEDVPVQVANLGGSLPFVIERMDHVYALRHPELPLPSQNLKPVYVDTASMGPRALEMAVGTYGADRILFGTDIPIFDHTRCISATAQSRLGDPEKAMILKSNAAALLARVTP